MVKEVESSGEKEGEFKEPLPKKIKTEEENKENSVEKVEEKPKKRVSKEEARKLRLKEIFTKRTVGDKFEQELSDYFMRKASRQENKSYIERE